MCVWVGGGCCIDFECLTVRTMQMKAKKILSNIFLNIIYVSGTNLPVSYTLCF